MGGYCFLQVVSESTPSIVRKFVLWLSWPESITSSSLKASYLQKSLQLLYFFFSFLVPLYSAVLKSVVLNISYFSFINVLNFKRLFLDIELFKEFSEHVTDLLEIYCYLFSVHFSSQHSLSFKEQIVICIYKYIATLC